MNTLLLEYLCKASHWSKITMDHAGEFDWFPKGVHVTGNCSLVQPGG